jgi:hypothetical protein
MPKRSVDNNTKILSNKTTAATITIILILTITATLVAVPLTNALDSSSPIPTWTYVGVSPEIIGVNQQSIIVFWCNFIPPTAIGAYGDRWTFYVDITRPDGTNETLGPFTSDPVGGAYTTYTPTQVGAYTIVARMDEHTIDGGKSRGMENPFGPVTWPSLPGNQSIGDVFQASSSEPITLTVQQEPVLRYEETPLSEGYWERPVYGANHDWGTVMGQWLNYADTPGRINAYTTGPESSHILWTRPFWEGGVAGGSGDANFGSIGYYSRLSYEGYGGPTIILNGKVYYKVGVNPIEGWYCVDLYTGKTVYFQNTTGPATGVGGVFAAVGSIPYGFPAFGQVYDYESPNQHGTISYLWVTSTGKPGTWDMLDSFTGNYICSINNLPSWLAPAALFAFPDYTASYGLDGSILAYHIQNYGTLANPNYYLQCWNTSQAIMYPNTLQTANQYWMWRPYLNTTFDGQYGYSINASIPYGDSILQIVEGREVIAGYTQRSVPGSFAPVPLNNGTISIPGRMSAYNLDPTEGKIGDLLWTYNFTGPAGLGNAALQNLQFSAHDVAFGGVDAGAGIFWYVNTMTRVRYVYDLTNGKPLWTSAPEPQFNFYGISTSVYQGKMFSYGNSGVLIAYNATTGEVLWNWTAPFVGVDESAWEHTPLSLGCIADEKLYFYSSEHSPSQPLRRDAKLYCVDAETGTMLWAITCWPSASPIIADGRIVALDLFDMQIYCYGKGPSATTVSAPLTVPSLGSSVMITGTVTDQSSGAEELAQRLGFANGVPAIADDSMDAWIEYLYHQRPIPTNATGVEVSLDTVDPNGNYVHIGTVTSDITGAYGYKWTPDVPGTYQVIATFAGSASYGASSAQTYVGVNEAPTATAPPEYPQPIDNTMTIIVVGIAIIIVMVLIGIWIRRK